MSEQIQGTTGYHGANAKGCGGISEQIQGTTGYHGANAKGCQINCFTCVLLHDMMMRHAYGEGMTVMLGIGGVQLRPSCW